MQPQRLPSTPFRQAPPQTHVKATRTISTAPPQPTGQSEQPAPFASNPPDNLTSRNPSPRGGHVPQKPPGAHPRRLKRRCGRTIRLENRLLPPPAGARPRLTTTEPALPSNRARQSRTLTCSTPGDAGMARISRPADKTATSPNLHNRTTPRTAPLRFRTSDLRPPRRPGYPCRVFSLAGARKAAKTTAGPGGEAPRITNTNRDKWYITNSGTSMCVRPWTWTRALLHYMSENIESANGVLRVGRCP